MRITNSMITQNTMGNVNKSKNNLYTVEEQMSSQKKITRPSDDPIIAIRALSLRTSLTEITMYLKKNVPDARAWMQATETSLDNMDGILSDMATYCNQGSTDSFTVEDRSAIVQSLTQLKEAYYDEGNADYSGRYIFSGYRTDTSVTFQTEEKARVSYEITQDFGSDDFSKTQYMKNAVDISKTDAAIAAADTPEAEDVYRLRLAYKNCSGNVAPTINLVEKDDNGKVIAANTYPNVQTISSSDFEKLVTSDIGMEPDTAYYIYDIGEVAFEEQTYKALKESGQDFSVTYQKDNFLAKDLRPEHYFNCKDLTNNVDYHYAEEGQAIEYTVNFSQSLRVNTEAKKVLSPEMGRDVDDLIASLESLRLAEEKVTKLKSMKDTGLYDEATIESMITAANKECDYAKEFMKSTFAAGITKMKGYQDVVAQETADLGGRSVRLTLTESRLTEQQSTFKDLKSKNEDLELEEIAVEFSATETVYNAAIAAASKTVRQSLLDYL